MLGRRRVTTLVIDVNESSLDFRFKVGFDIFLQLLPNVVRANQRCLRIHDNMNFDEEFFPCMIGSNCVNLKNFRVVG